jgi:hypothetical protein
VKVKFSPRVRRRVKLLSSWWKANRPSAPWLFDEELEQPVERLKSQPTLGLVYQASAPTRTAGSQGMTPRLSRRRWRATWIEPSAASAPIKPCSAIHPVYW